MKCACWQEHHEMCYDSFSTFPDENCTCCADTLYYQAFGERMGDLEKVDSREVYNQNDEENDGNR